MDKNEKQINTETMREKFANVSGERYWRGLEELVDTAEFQSWMEDEFPQRASIPDVDRRTFLKLAGASLALAGLAGCRSLPEERIVPYVKAPEDSLPGQELTYASTMPFDGYGFGVLVSSNEHRPTKIEGNDRHPASLGSTDIFSQAEILNMYDPDRSGNPLQMLPGQVPLMGTWEEALAEITNTLGTLSNGAGIRLLTETVTSPTLYAQIQAFLAKYKQAKWYQYQAISRDNQKKGSVAAFGRIVDTRYDLSNAVVILALDSDILGCTPETVRYIRDFMARRGPDLPFPQINRLYSVESTFSKTGAFADHRFALKHSDIPGFTQYLASALGVAAAGPGRLPEGVKADWVAALVRDLVSHKGSALITVGETQPPEVHALAHAMNEALGAVGKTVNYLEPIEPHPVIHNDELTQLTAEMAGHQVDALFILGGNPAYSAPPDVPFATELQRLTAAKKLTVRHGIYNDETSALCQWHLPDSHFLEAWGDLRSYDGTTSIVQPLILPLFDTRSAIEVISQLVGKPQNGLDMVRKQWSSLKDQPWRDCLEKGFIDGTASKPAAVTAKVSSLPSTPASGADAIEAVFAPDSTVWDGRYSNNGWLQELPKALTRMSWDNPVIIGPKLAVQLDVIYEDNVELTANGATVIAPVYVLPGMPDNTVTLTLGYGRTTAGKVGDGTGFNFNPLRKSSSPWVTTVEIKKAGSKTDLALSQTHHSMDGRDIVREGTHSEYLSHQSLEPREAMGEDESAILYNLTKEWQADNPDIQQWGMTIDLNTCTGCSACEIACQAENNIPTVGKEQVQRGRIMHWIRVDRYFRVEDAGEERDFKEPIAQYESINPSNDTGAMDPNNVKVVSMPVPCMHCEEAPCEPVCPVAATIHSHEGLNQMVYNRCVGTRYCSNNCPYKVRRFNFFNFQFRQKQFQSERDITLLNLMNNPDVSVRSRGVMEKCSYCVQRINEARITAKKENRKIKDMEVIPACAQACPSKAIVFGDISDPTTAVSKLKAQKRNYGLLEDLNTRPRTSYLAKVRNPNPEISNAAANARGAKRG
ncbi:MAG TPA: TAT-variant-translocated molybdopterin oxidoreductase [Fimbriimonadaceae bacterium]|jgi:molybdopterin-containing oxidoreductase family iron-sulfur binding subunit